MYYFKDISKKGPTLTRTICLLKNFPGKKIALYTLKLNTVLMACYILI